jgi:hypothetical protein
MGTRAPLTSLASSESRNDTTPAIDAGATQRDGSAAGIAARLAGVSIVLGRTALRRTP